jgi:hypothetical protein
MKPWHIIAGAMILGAIFMTVNRGPRGIRNNNPLNIERTNDRWQGMAEHQNDDRFLVFTDARYGYRAAARIVSNYQARGLKTLAQIVSTWAPSVENDTLSYINSVAKRAGIEPDQVVTDSEIVQLFEAMTWHENGEQPYSLDTIAEGVSWA